MTQYIFYVNLIYFELFNKTWLRYQKNIDIGKTGDNNNLLYNLRKYVHSYVMKNTVSTHSDKLLNRKINQSWKLEARH